MLAEILKALARDDEGQDLVEWSLLMGLIVLVSVGVITSWQTSYVRLWHMVGNGINAAITALH